MSQQELNTPPPMAERTKQAAFIPRQQVASTSREPEGNSDSLFPKQHHDHQSVNIFTKYVEKIKLNYN